MISMVQAGGFRVSLQGVRQAAMAHTSAHVRDASVAFFNPGGIAFIPSKLSISAGGFLVGTKVNYQNLQTHYKASTDNPISTPMTFNVAYKATNQISVALSITTPFGSIVNWGEDWAGKDLINKIELQAFYIQPTVAYRFNNWISVGAGFIYATGNVNLQKSLTPVNGQMKLEDKNASGNGFNVGVYLRPTDKLDISVAYRSKVDMKAKKGKAEFDIPSSLVGESPFLTSTDQFSATLPLASEFTLGLTYRVLPKLSISADWNVSGWNRYENLTFNFKKNQVGNLENDPTVSMVPKKFKNSNTFRIGGEYLATEDLAVRLGYYYDQSPVRSNFWSPETPSTNNNAVTGGVGYSFYNKKLMVDLSGIYYVGKSRKFNNEFYNFSGEANLSSFIVGLGLTWNPF
ncbi:aromatic hydrocarbon degradation protein [Apibacter muscae]|uniref:OmpP1/FadL family transporter n=1 Tax=Apibacter muscae TaxID=2509004 RepID=UPI0011ADA797|nr:outer membrane protein transport protein [Apibacter muscae]TWP24039.1 aromatic hydrocarbon degradation protein [Apibacter muscae]